MRAGRWPGAMRRGCRRCWRTCCAGAREPGVLLADANDPAALQAMAAQGRVLFNLAGPYHATGDAVVAACIAGGTHYLIPVGRDLLDAAADRRAARRGTARTAEDHALRRLRGAALRPGRAVGRAPAAPAMRRGLRRSDDRGRGHRPAAGIDPRDLVSGGTAATVTELLAHDHSDCLRDMACLLPPEAADAAAVAQGATRCPGCRTGTPTCRRCWRRRCPGPSSTRRWCCAAWR